MAFQMLQITDAEFNKIRDLMYEETGVFLRDTKRILVISRLRKRLEHFGMMTFSEYYSYVIKNTEELHQFINAITTNETFFFRNDKHFEFIKKNIIPEYISKNKMRNIKIWSAACSTGEEPYSIYIYLLENVPNPSTWNFNIEASDINTEVLETARNGIYIPQRLRNTPENIEKKYFNRIQGERGSYSFELRREFRSKIKFRQHNLRQVYPVNNFDIVFLRNVLIYFDHKMKDLVINNMKKVIKPNGYLFLGHAEGMLGMDHTFEYIEPSVYRKKEV
ncbi:MAG: protein-glutamate O-methyltransferase CheR [Oligoflexia bacterium]|nr:protein-glutamate O-methyltransferase CheR [Oligoflexia bacterium]